MKKELQKFLNEANENIRMAKKFDYPEWLMEYVPGFLDWRKIADKKLREATKQDWEKAVSNGKLKEEWEEMRNNNIVPMHDDGETFEKLEKLGEIEIIKRGLLFNGKVKILNPKF